MESGSLFATVIVVIVSTGAQAYPTDKLECDRMLSVSLDIRDCVLLNDTSALPTLFMRLIQGAKSFTKDELLTEVDMTCRNPEIKQRYLNCGEMISNNCPAVGIQEYIGTNIDERLAIFCEKNTASSWIREVLPNDYTFQTDCIKPKNPVVTIIQQCLKKYIDINNAHIWDQSVQEVLALLLDVHKKWFPCTIDQAEETFQGGTKLDCGMPWQDMLLTYWLLSSSSNVLGPVIRNEEMNTLQEMMLSRV